MHAAADATPFCRLCDVHWNCKGGDAPMALHASQIHSVMVHDVHASGVSSHVMVEKVVGLGPMSR
jgi:hypothetical protein